MKIVKKQKSQLSFEDLCRGDVFEPIMCNQLYNEGPYMKIDNCNSVNVVNLSNGHTFNYRSHFLLKESPYIKKYDCTLHLE